MSDEETSAETPAGDGNAPLATSAQLAAARTSHLTGFAPKLDEPNVDGDEPLELPKQKFPKTLRESIELRREFQQEKPTTARDQILKNLTLDALALHIQTLENIPVVKPISNAQHSNLAQIQTDHALAIAFDDRRKRDRVVGHAADAYEAAIAILEARIDELEKQLAPAPKE